MAITHVGQDDESGASGNTTDMTFTLPTHQADDFGIIIASYRNTLTATMAIGTATGWTQIGTTKDTTAGDDIRSMIWYKKFTSSSETNPAVTIDLGRNRSALLHVFRGVDTTTPFDVTHTEGDGTNSATPTNPAITTGTANACVLLWHNNTNTEITVYGKPTAPTGLADGVTTILLAGGNVQQFTAYKLDVGAAATITPDAWTHTAVTTVGEYHTYTIALRAQAAAAGVVPQLMMMGIGA